MTTPVERDEILQQLYAKKESAQRAGETDVAEQAQKHIDELQRQAVIAQKESSPLASLEHYGAGMLNRIGQGITGGHLDEMAATFDFMSDNPRQMDIDRRRAGLEQFDEDVGTPASLGLDLFGSIIGPGKFVTKAKEGGSLLTKAKHYAKEGGWLGALEGSGRTEEETVGGQAVDTAIGATAGAVLNPGIAGATDVGGRLFSYMRGKFSQWAKSDHQKAQEMISQAAERTGMGVDDIMERVDELGPEATLMDLNDVLRGVALTARGAGNEALDTIVDTVTTRQVGARGRLQEDVREAAGSVDPYIASRTGLADAKTQAGDELYGAVESAMIPRSNELDAILAHESVVPLLRDVELAESARRGVSMTFVGDDIPLVLLDSLKKSMDDKVVQVTDKVNKTNRNRNQETLFKTMAKKLRNLVDEVEPGYATARESSAAHTGLLSSMEEGSKLASTRGVKLDEMVEDVSTRSVSEQDAFRVGAADSINRSLPDGRLANPAQPLSGSGDAQVRMDAVSATPEARGQLAERVDAETTFNETMRMMNPNVGSKTSFVDEATDRNVGETAAQLVSESMMFGSPAVTASKMIVEELASTTKVTPGVAKEIADMVTKQNLTRADVTSILTRRFDLKESEVSKIVRAIDNILGRGLREGAAMPGVGGVTAEATGLLTE